MYFIPKDVPLSSRSTTTTTAESTTATTTTSVAEESTTEEDDEEIEEARWTKSYGPAMGTSSFHLQNLEILHRKQHLTFEPTRGGRCNTTGDSRFLLS